MFEKKLKHLEFTQNVITKLMGMSFLAKGWCITLVAAFLAFYSRDMNKLFLAIPFLPLIVFWLLDAYITWKEILYKNRYNKVRLTEEADIDFDMGTYIFKNNTKGWFGSMFVPKVMLTYVLILITLLILIAYHIFVF